MPVDGEI